MVVSTLVAGDRSHRYIPRMMMGALRCLIGEVGGTIKNTASTRFVGEV